MNTITVVDAEGVSFDFEQVTPPRKEDAEEGKAEGAHRPADPQAPTGDSQGLVDASEDSLLEGRRYAKLLGKEIVRKGELGI